MSWQRIVAAAAVVLVGFFAAESNAAACITGASCSGTKPTCDLLSFSCRACKSDAECGAPLSGDVCAASGACVSAADAGSRNCTDDSECDLLGGFVCSGSLCIAGCHLSVLGDTCLVGAHCILPVNANIGICGGGDAGVGGLDAGGHLLDSGLVGCVTDGDCGLSSGLVCSAGACVVGCHDTAAGDTCPGGTTCSVLGGLVGVCLAPSADGGVTACSKDSDCGSPGLVCDGSKCVVGCHAQVGADTCPVGATCSILSGTLGVCIGAPGDGGVGGCSSDTDCSGGLVCSGPTNGQCVVGCHVTSSGDTCLVGAQCSILTGGLGICLGSGPDSGIVGLGPDGGSVGSGSDGGPAGFPMCTTDPDCGQGLVCDSSACVVGCHDGVAGDTCPTGSHCNATGTGVGVCVGTTADGGVASCASDSDCSQGLVCDALECVVGCHSTPAGGDTCAAGTKCDAVGGSLGVCTGTTSGGDDSGAGGGGDDSGATDGGNAPSDASASSSGGGHGHGADAGEGAVIEGGGCSCSSGGRGPAEGGAAAFLLGLAVFARRRKSRPSK
jgi:MYXO-CTERM domain-containing protein